MGTAKTIISVAILGDAKNLIGAVTAANTATGGLVTSAAKVFIAGGLIKKGFGSLDNALDNADRFSDALDDIAGTMTPAFAEMVRQMSDDFTNIGLSSVEVAELAASWANLATAAGVSQPLIAEMTPDLLSLAAAIAATQGRTVDEVIKDIGLAAAGNQKAVRDYGLVIDSALNPNAQILSILQQLTDKFPDAKAALDDYTGSQDKLNAKWDTFTTNVGTATEGPLNDVLDWFVSVSNMIPSALDGWGMLGEGIIGTARNVLGPLGNVADVLREIIKLFPGAQQAAMSFIGPAGSPVKSSFTISDSGIQRTNDRNNNRNGVVSNRIGGV